MGTSEKGFDFSDFFHLFMDSFVANMRDCLLEWLNAATAATSASSSSSSQELSTLTQPSRSLGLLSGEVVAFCFEERVHGITVRLYACLYICMYVYTIQLFTPKHYIHAASLCVRRKRSGSP